MSATALGPANVLSELEVRRVLDTFSTSRINTRNRALVIFLWRTGLRCSEALELRRHEVSLDAERPHLRVRNGKGGNHRTVGLSTDAAAAIRGWWDKAPESEFVFSTLRGSKLDDGYVRAMLSAAGKRAGVARVHPHAFRATLAVELSLEGQPLPVVRDVLGHANIAHTDAYLRRVFPEMAVDALVNRVAA